MFLGQRKSPITKNTELVASGTVTPTLHSSNILLQSGFLANAMNFMDMLSMQLGTNEHYGRYFSILGFNIHSTYHVMYFLKKLNVPGLLPMQASKLRL